MNKEDFEKIDKFVGRKVIIFHKNYEDHGKLTFCKNSRKWKEFADKFRYCLGGEPYNMHGAIKIKKIRRPFTKEQIEIIELTKAYLSIPCFWLFYLFNLVNIPSPVI